MACHTKLPKKVKLDDELATKNELLGPTIESKFEELRQEIIQKIEKELEDSQNARDYISQKYDELCHKIQYLTELEATVNGFRSDVRFIEKHIQDLASRVDVIQKRASCRDSMYSSSSML